MAVGAWSISRECSLGVDAVDEVKSQRQAVERYTIRYHACRRLPRRTVSVQAAEWAMFVSSVEENGNGIRYHPSLP